MVKAFTRKVTTRALRRAVKDLVAETRNSVRHRRGVRAVKRLPAGEPLRIQLGCGPRPKPGWINVDLAPEADISLDLREPLPFASASASMIYSEHFLEHLDHPGPAEQLLRECHRVLVPGGRVSFSVPGVRWAFEKYMTDDRDWFRLEKENGSRPEWVKTPIDSINYLFRQDGEHRFAYDAETLTLRLTEAGFVDVARRDFDPSLDSEDRRYSLFVDGVKPTDG